MRIYIYDKDLEIASIMETQEGEDFFREDGHFCKTFLNPIKWGLGEGFVVLTPTNEDLIVDKKLNKEDQKLLDAVRHYKEGVCNFDELSYYIYQVLNAKE